MSSQIDALKTRRFAVWQAMHDLANVAAGENRAFTEFEQGQWEPLSTELDSIDRRIDALLEVEKREAGAAAEFDKFARGLVERPDLPGARAGGTGMFESRSTWLPWLPSYARYRELEQRAVGSGSNVFIAPEQATIWFDRLRAASVFLQANPIVVPVNDTQLNVPRVVGSATAQMLAENTAITPSDPTSTPAVALLPRCRARRCARATSQACVAHDPGRDQPGVPVGLADVGREHRLGEARAGAALTP